MQDVVLLKQLHQPEKAFILQPVMHNVSATVCAGRAVDDNAFFACSQRWREVIDCARRCVST